MDSITLKRLAVELAEFSMKDRYYIVDCFGRITGNRKGYATIRGAMQQANSRKSKAYRDLWRAFNNWEGRNPNHNRVYSIVSGESLYNTIANQGQ